MFYFLTEKNSFKIEWSQLQDNKAACDLQYAVILHWP